MRPAQGQNGTNLSTGTRRSADRRRRPPLVRPHPVAHRGRRRVLLPRLRGRPQLPAPHRPQTPHRPRHPAVTRGTAGPVVECAACQGHFGTETLDHPTTTRFSAMLRDAVHTVALAVLAAGGTSSRTVTATAVATVRAAGFEDCTEEQLVALIEALAADTGRFLADPADESRPLRRRPRHRTPRGAGAARPAPRSRRPRVHPAPGRAHRPRGRPLQRGRTRGAHHRRRRAVALRGRHGPPSRRGPHTVLALQLVLAHGGLGSRSKWLVLPPGPARGPYAAQDPSVGWIRESPPGPSPGRRARPWRGGGGWQRGELRAVPVQGGRRLAVAAAGRFGDHEILCRGCPR